MAIHHDPDVEPRELLDLLYAGDLVVLTGLPAVGALVDLAREELTALFAPDDPSTRTNSGRRRTSPPCSEHGSHGSCAIRMSTAWCGRSSSRRGSTRAARTTTCRSHVRRSRSGTSRQGWRSPSRGTVTPGTAHPAAGELVLPVSRVLSDNAMGFDLASFDRSVANDSAGFDYYALNANRSNIAAQVTRELQARPSAPGHAVTDEVVVLPEPGSILLFSGAHLHRSIPNTSGRARFSIDFRTVDVDDLVGDVGARPSTSSAPAPRFGTSATCPMARAWRRGWSRSSSARRLRVRS